MHTREMVMYFLIGAFLRVGWELGGKVAHDLEIKVDNIRYA